MGQCYAQDDGPTRADQADMIGAFWDAILEADDIVEMRLIPAEGIDEKPRSRWCNAAGLRAQLAWAMAFSQARWGVYIGPNPRRAHGGTKAADVLLGRCLWADFDPKGDETLTWEECREKVRAKGLPEPTCWVASGRGFHAYWRLTEPLTDLARWTAYQKRLAACLESDPAVTDAPRVMRLPGFVNHKNGEPCRVTAVNQHCRYDVGDVMAKVPELPPEDDEHTKQGQGKAVAALRPVDPDHAERCHYGQEALRRELDKLRNAPPGDRNNQCNKTTFVLTQLVAGGCLPEAKVRAAVPQAAAVTGLPADEIDSAFDSGFAAGMKHPRQCACRDAVPRAFNDPERLAAEFVAANAPHHHWQAEFYQWTGRHWTRQSGDMIDATLRRHCVAAFETYWRGAEQDRERRLAELRQQPNNEKALAKAEKPTPCPAVTRRTVDEVAAALRSRVILPDDVTDGTWIPDCSKPNWLAMRNGVLNLDTGTLRGHDPAFFNLSSLPYDFNPQATCPKFTAAVNHVLGDEENKVLFLQELFGYCLCPGQKLQKFFCLVGEGGNGKGVIATVLTSMIGRENVGSLSLRAFSDPYSLVSLVGKKLNIGSEIRDDPQVAEDVLKQITGGDTLAMNRKNLPWLAAKIDAKLVFLVNDLPKFVDRSNGIWDRFLPLHFTVKVRGTAGQEIGMEEPDYWAAELPGVLVWAMEGRARLLKNKGFTLPESSRAMAAEHRLASNPVAMFVQERVDTKPDADSAWVGKDELYSRFRNWYADNHPSGKVMSKDAFCREFMRHTKCVEGRPRSMGADGRECRVRAFQGVRYKYGPDAGAGDPEPTPDAALLDTVLTNSNGLPF